MKAARLVIMCSQLVCQAIPWQPNARTSRRWFSSMIVVPAGTGGLLLKCANFTKQLLVIILKIIFQYRKTAKKQKDVKQGSSAKEKRKRGDEL